MKYDSRNRLARLEQMAQVKGQAARDAQSRRNTLTAALTAARRELSEAEAALFTRSFWKNEVTGTEMSPSEVEAKVERLAARVAELEADLAAADQHAAATRDAANDAGRLLRACTDFAVVNRLPLPSSPRVPGADPKAHVEAQGVVR